MSSLIPRKVVYEPDQLLDYFLLSLLDNLTPSEVEKALVDNEISGISSTKIKNRIEAIQKGKYLPQPTSEFGGKVCNRYGKSLAYEGLWTLADIYLPDHRDRYYVGLPANQITAVAKHCSKRPMVILEHNSEVYEKSKKLAEWTKKITNQEIEIKNQDLWSYLRTTDKQFSIFDLDLMCHTSEEVVRVWANLIRKCSMNGINLILLVNSIGNGLYETEYDNHLQLFLEALDQKEVEVIGHSDIKHRDRKVPMRSQRIVIYKEGETK